MSVPSFLLTPVEPPDALQPGFEVEKFTHGWAAPTSITADPVPSHVEDQSNTIQNTFLPLQAADFHMLQQAPHTPCIEPRLIDLAATAERFMFPDTPQDEKNSLETWLHIPHCQAEPVTFQTVPAHEELDAFEPLWPPEEVLFDKSNLEDFSAMAYSQTSIPASLETMKEDLEQFQPLSDAVQSPETIAQPTENLPSLLDSKGKSRTAQGYIIDEVLNTLRQMDYNLRAANRQHMDDIASSSLG